MKLIKTAYRTLSRHALEKDCNSHRNRNYCDDSHLHESEDWNSSTQSLHSCAGKNPIIPNKSRTSGILTTIKQLIKGASTTSKLQTPEYRPLLSVYCLLTTVLLFTACTPPAYLSEKDLLEYIRDESNGLVKTKEATPFNLTVQYRPNDLLVLQEVGNRRESELIAKAKAKYENYAYFILSLEAAGKNALYGASPDMGAFSENLQTLSFRMADKVSLITSEKDTVEVADYIFDRTYGMGSTTLMFVFNKEKLKEADWFTFNLKEFGMRIGDHRFRFNIKDLQNIPGLLDISHNQKSALRNIPGAYSKTLSELQLIHMRKARSQQRIPNSDRRITNYPTPKNLNTQQPKKPIANFTYFSILAKSQEPKAQSQVL